MLEEFLITYLGKNVSIALSFPFFVLIVYFMIWALDETLKRKSRIEGEK